MKMFIIYIYFLKKFVWGFVGWFLSALLLLKIIFSVKRCYVGVLGNIKICRSFVGVLFKTVKIQKEYALKTAPVFPKTHYYKYHQHVVTGDIRVVRNYKNKTSKLLKNKGPKYRNKINI